MVASTVSAQAEDSIIHRNVTVEREYKPVIQNAGKINFIPEVLEPAIEKTAPNYSDFNLPLVAGFNIHTLKAAELQRDTLNKSKSGYARLGLGNYYNTLADFAYPVIKKPDMQLDASLNHCATFGKKTHSFTKGSLSFDKQFDKFDLYAGQGATHEYLRYYGNNFNTDSLINLSSLAKTHGGSYFTGTNSAAHKYTLNDIVKDSLNTFWRYEAFAGIRSQSSAKGLRYQAEVRYKLFDTRNKLAEHLIHTQAGFSNQSKENRIGLDFDLFNSIYHADNVLLPNFHDSYWVLSLNPYYSIERPDWDIRLGAKSGIAIKHGRTFSPSADIRAEWKAVPKYVSMYGGVTGSYDVNTLYDISTVNRYIFPDVRVANTYTPYDLFAGILVKPVYNLLLDVSVDYRQINNQYFFVNKGYELTSSTTTVPISDSTIYSNKFDVVYSSASVFKIGLRANYNFQDRITVELKGAYNGWDVNTERYAWNKPKWEASLNTAVHINSNLSISANAFLESERYAKLGTRAICMQPKVDINVGASYEYNNWVTAFVKINNLINNPFEYYYGYQEQGINGMVGASFSF
jgi:hypothetical protein